MRGKFKTKLRAERVILGWHPTDKIRKANTTKIRKERRKKVARDRYEAGRIERMRVNAEANQAAARRRREASLARAEARAAVLAQEIDGAG